MPFYMAILKRKCTCECPLGFHLVHPAKCVSCESLFMDFARPPRQWFAKLSSKLCEYGFVHSYADYSLFVYQKGTVFLAVLVYVDDIVLTGNDTQACKDFKTYLHACLSIKDLGPLKYFLGIEVARGPPRNVLVSTQVCPGDSS